MLDNGELSIESEAEESRADFVCLQMLMKIKIGLKSRLHNDSRFPQHPA